MIQVYVGAVGGEVEERHDLLGHKDVSRNHRDVPPDLLPGSSRSPVRSNHYAGVIGLATGLARLAQRQTYAPRVQKTLPRNMRSLPTIFSWPPQSSH